MSFFSRTNIVILSKKMKKMDKYGNQKQFSYAYSYNGYYVNVQKQPFRGVFIKVVLHGKICNDTICMALIWF